MTTHVQSARAEEARRGRSWRSDTRNLRLVIGLSVSLMVFAFTDLGIALAFAVGFVLDWLLGRG